jgi:phage-related holin
MVVPILLVILGSIDYAKGIMSQKDDETKKGQQAFIKRIITGLIVFLIVAIVKLLVSIVGDSSANKQNIISCIDCFINNTCQSPSTTAPVTE